MEPIIYYQNRVRHFKKNSFACRGEGQRAKHLGSRMMALRELQSATGEELSALLPSVLDRAFTGEL